MPPLLDAFPYGARVVKARIMRRPILSQASLYVTHRCNLRCVYCSSPYRRTPELTTAQWLGVITELAQTGCRRVQLLGGEPLVRKDIGAIIASVKAQNMRCVLTSNGLLVPHRLDALRLLDTLILSLDAVGPGNDKVRGDGVTAAVKKAIQLARKAGIPTKLNAVMTRESAPYLDELVRFVTEQDLSLTVNVVRHGNDALWHRAATVKQDDAAVRELLLKLARLSRDNPRILFSELTYRFAASWPDYDRDRLTCGDTLHQLPADGPRCHAGRAYFSIDPDGSTYPCPLTADSISGGSVLAEGVEQAWRNLAKHPCRSCYTPCNVEQNYLHSLRVPVVRNFVRKHLPHYF